MSSATKAEPDAYWFQDWCAANGLPVTAGYREIRDGKIQTFTIGRRRYVSAKASREYFAAREREASK